MKLIFSGFNITEALSSNIDDVTMHELYLWPFADAVRAGVGSIMCSYNQLNNSYGCQNSKMINNILKGELGFQGKTHYFHFMAFIDEFCRLCHERLASTARRSLWRFSRTGHGHAR